MCMFVVVYKVVIYCKCENMEVVVLGRSWMVIFMSVFVLFVEVLTPHFKGGLACNFCREGLACNLSFRDRHGLCVTSQAGE